MEEGKPYINFPSETEEDALNKDLKISPTRREKVLPIPNFKNPVKSACGVITHRKNNMAPRVIP